MKTMSDSRERKSMMFKLSSFVRALFMLLILNPIQAQDICRADTSFTDILVLIDNSQSIDDLEFDEFSDIIMGTINNIKVKCPSSQIGVVHYGGANGQETIIEFPFSQLNNIPDVQRQFCTVRNQFNNCQEGGGDDLNHAVGDILTFISDGSLNRNPSNKLVLVIFTDAFGFDDNCSFINCSVIRPFTNIDILKSQQGAQVTVVGASTQAEASLLAIYASPGGTFDNVQLFQEDCPTTFDGCTLPRKYIPIEFDSPVGPTSDSIASCVTCTVDIIGGVIADAGADQTLCEEEDLPATLSASLLNGTPPFTFKWDQDIGSGNNIQVNPVSTTDYSVTITDINGCSASDAVTVFVENCIPDCTAPPIIDCPNNVTICPGQDVSVDSLGMASATKGADACPDPIIGVRDSLVVIDDCNQTIFRIWTASYVDPVEGFSSSSCIQEIYITDNEAPTIIIMPDPIVIGSDDQCNAVVTWEEPYITDNCGLGSITSNKNSGDNFDLGITYVVFTATDLCGNIAMDSFSVEVIQQCCIDPPILTCPSDYFGCPMSSTDPAMTGFAVAQPSSDLCGIPSLSFTDEIVGFGTCEGEVFIKRIWMATDMDNNLVTTCEQLLTLTDTVPPMLLNCPPDVTIDPDNPTYEWNDPLVNENCGFRLEYNIPNGSTFPTGTTVVIAAAIDICGNVDTCSFTVTVPEEVMIICPDMPVIRCVDTLTAAMIPAPEVSSNCPLCETDPENCIQTTYQIDTIIKSGDRTLYSITYFATDLCNTDSECSTQIIIDNGAFLECPDDIIIEAPPYGFTYVTWNKPLFQTCCSACIPKQIPGYLYMGQLGDSYYYCSYARVKWNKAKRLSEEIGGYLASLNSAQENDFIARRLIERNAYIGLTDYASEGNFEWVDGSPVNFTKWKSGQPDNIGNENFVEMSSQGYWYDVDGQEKREFVVEIKGCDHVTQVGGPKSGSKFRIGTTTITYAAEDGCGYTDECSFNVIVTPYQLVQSSSLKTQEVSDLVTISPNPASLVLRINSGKELIQAIDIYRIDGALINRLNNVMNTDVKLNVASLSSGIHLVKVFLENGTYVVEKVLIE